ncbi:MAG: 23S rRNA (adenine(2503)-C(2))-methyltransferase RlmN [Deltaproteobacteria bacterium]|nr:23S rRNA (adenine(2503)-C(2))-methyltransferase RlmN [Deltaproteobacteria bacterium]
MDLDSATEGQGTAPFHGGDSDDPRRPLEDLGHAELSAWLDARGLPSYRADQIRRWLFQKHATEFESMTDLSRELRQALARSFVIGSLAVQQQSRSDDGTVKYLLRLRDSNLVETVYIPEPDRVTLCVSTQAGCGLGCAFCATARMGLKRNLTQAEILDQILEVQRGCPEERRISNLVFMGMGEPLANYDATRGALETITDAHSGMAISPRKITVSTVGLLPQMRRLMEETRVNLAISLHAARDDVRSGLMPVNRKYPVADLLECCRSLPVPRRKRITFEYLLLRGVNDLPADAAELARLLRGIRCKVNLIPFNPHEGSGFDRPPEDVIERFGEALRARGIQTHVRRPRGEDIQAACGQLYHAAAPEDAGGRARVAATMEQRRGAGSRAAQ